MTHRHCHPGKSRHYFASKKIIEHNMENTNQQLTYNSTEILNLWKTIMHLEPVRRDCMIERDDGIDIDALLTLHIRQWYAQLLETAPAEWLPIEDVKNDCRLNLGNDQVVTATLPPQCVRPVEWKLKGWQHSVTHFLKPGDPEAIVQQCEWTRGRSHCPAVIDMGNTMQLFSAASNSLPTLEVARCVVRPADDIYRFHAAALSTIPHSIVNF